MIQHNKKNVLQLKSSDDISNNNSYYNQNNSLNKPIFNEYSQTIKDDSTPKVIYKYYNPQELNQIRSNLETQDSNLKFSSGLFKSDEHPDSQNSNNNLGFSRIQVTKYYK